MIEFENLEEKKIASEEIFKGKVLNVFKDTVLLPNGDTATRELIKHIGAVCVVAITDDCKVIVEKQFRYPIGKVITEIPAGKLDSKYEDRLEAAKRELKEETGISASYWQELGEYYPSGAYTDEVISMYLAQILEFGEQKLDSDEFLNFTAVPLNDLVNDILDGKIADGKTQAAILKTAVLLLSDR